MAIREDLVSSAITFLYDSSVANAPLDKKIAFLQSKNLTQEEVDAALIRSGSTGADGRAAASSQQQQQALRYSPPPPQQQQQQYPYGNYGQYPGSYWGAPPPPPEIPRRDWRDYFIMATVMSGLGYGVYFLTKRYIAPLIAPPTPPQLEQDKASVDASFERAFALIDQLAADTAGIKAAEESRKEKLDSALTDMESAIAELKLSSRRRDDESSRISSDIHTLQGMIPKAMKAQEEATDARLKELNGELKSLKTLLANRMTTPAASVAAATTTAPVSSASPISTAVNARLNGGTYESSEHARLDAVGSNSNGTPPPVNGAGAASVSRGVSPNPLSTATANSGNPYSQISKYGSGKGGIPAWQMAASKKSGAEESKADSPTIATTTTDAQS